MSVGVALTTERNVLFSCEFEKLIGKLLNAKREEPIAITAALRGAGGYGKTTMARAICHDERISVAPGRSSLMKDLESDMVDAQTNNIGAVEMAEKLLELQSQLLYR